MPKFTYEEVQNTPDQEMEYLACKKCQMNFDGVAKEDLCLPCQKEWAETEETRVKLCGNCAQRIRDGFKEGVSRLMALHDPKHAQWIDPNCKSGGRCIDVGVFELCRLLEDKGYEIASSCEGDPDHFYGRAHIMFEDVEEAAGIYLKMLSWIWKHDLELAKRNSAGHSNPTTKLDLDVSPMFYKYAEDGNAEFYLSGSWLLAYEDIAKVTEILKEIL